MKYPLAMVDHLVETYGSDICLGYDIMCAFIKTLSRSCLGAKRIAFRLEGVVPSFHGHAHNRGCQLHWHPMYREGVGLEERANRFLEPFASFLLLLPCGGLAGSGFLLLLLLLLLLLKLLLVLLLLLLVLLELELMVLLLELLL